MNNIYGATLALLLAVAGTTANAATVFTSGAGSAVSSVDASADFENTAALYGNPYVEDGISFSRTGLSFNNNGCGYAGCTYHSGFFGSPTPFSGNYMYGTGSGGTFTIETTLGKVFTALEMILGSGGSSTNFSWTTYLGGATVSSGITATLDVPSIHGWSDINGFDKLVFSAGNTAPAFDTVKAQYSVSAVPVPAAGVLLLAAIGGLGVAGRRRKAA